MGLYTVEPQPFNDSEVQDVFARMTRYEGSSPDSIDSGLETKRRILPTALGQTEGMKGIIFFADRSAGTLLTVSLWESKDAMDASEEIAARLREDVTAEGETASVERYEIPIFAVEQSPGEG